VNSVAGELLALPPHYHPTDCHNVANQVVLMLHRLNGPFRVLLEELNGRRRGTSSCGKALLGVVVCVEVRSLADKDDPDDIAAVDAARRQQKAGQ
jgi:hypothetical protein